MCPWSLPPARAAAACPRTPGTPSGPPWSTWTSSRTTPRREKETKRTETLPERRARDVPSTRERSKRNCKVCGRTTPRREKKMKRTETLPERRARDVPSTRERSQRSRKVCGRNVLWSVQRQPPRLVMELRRRPPVCVRLLRSSPKPLRWCWSCRETVGSPARPLSSQTRRMKAPATLPAGNATSLKTPAKVAINGDHLSVKGSAAAPLPSPGQENGGRRPHMGRRLRRGGSVLVSVVTLHRTLARNRGPSDQIELVAHARQSAGNAEESWSPACC